MSANSYAILDDRGILSISGEDRVAFLQNLVSNDVTRTDHGRAVYAALLTPQGKFLFDFLLGSAWRCLAAGYRTGANRRTGEAAVGLQAAGEG